MAVPVVLHGQDSSFHLVSDPSEIQVKIAKIAKETTSIQSDFEQEKHISFMSEPMISKGKFYFKQENKIRWEYTDPYKYAIVMNEGKITIFDGENKNRFDVKSKIIFNRINEMMLNTIKGNVLNNNEFDNRIYENDQFVLVRLKPIAKQIKKHIDQIDIYFNKKDIQVSEIKITEQSGDDTRIFFKNRVLNQNVADSYFIVN